jgi:DNA polymerase I-like protein with 3'-5' exonuclease and polymerase domains
MLPKILEQERSKAYASASRQDRLSYEAGLPRELSGELAIDTETTGLNPRRDKVVGISLSQQPEEAWAYRTLNVQLCLPPPSGNVVAHNWQFDEPALKQVGWDLDCSFDTMVAAYVLGKERLGLKWLSEHELDVKMQGIDDLILTGKYTMADVPWELVVPYACADADQTLQLKHKFAAELAAEPKLQDIFDLEMRVLPMLIRMTDVGVRLDVDHLKSLETEIEAEMNLVLAQLRQVVNKPEFNPDSPPQLSRLLFDELGIEPLRSTDTPGQFATSKEVLEELKGEHPIIDMVMQYRSLRTLLRTFITKLPEIVDPLTGRIHTQWKQTVVVTGRLSSSPNCLSPDTEVLTRTGWCRIDEYHHMPHGDSAEHIAQYDFATETISFVEPLRTIEVPTDEFVYRASQHIDLMATRNHRCPLVKRSGRLEIRNAEDYVGDRKQLHAGHYAFGSKRLSVAEITLIAAIQADGHLTSSGAIDWGLKKPRKIVRLRSCLKALGLKYTERPTSRGVTRLYLWAKDAALWRRYKRGYGHWVLELTRQTAERLLEEVLFWDGSWTTRSQYSSNDKTNADWIQILAVLTNRRANVREYTGSKNPNWQVDLTDRNYSWTTNTTCELIRAPEGVQGAAFCVQVPTSFFLIRRNGKVIVTGNCQNIPIHGEIGDKIRAAFVPTPGNCFVGSDYKAIEVRILAHLSQDERLCELITKGEDPHRLTASYVFSLKPEDVTDNLRQLGKTAFFAIAYRAGEYRISQLLRPMLTLAEATELVERRGTPPRLYDRSLATGSDPYIQLARLVIKGINKLYSGVGRWQEKEIARATERGYTESMDGRRRYLPFLREASKKARGASERIACNHPIQSSAADIMKRAMDAVWQAFKHEDWFMPELQVHDELQIEAPPEKADELEWAMKEIMPSVVKLSVPLEVDTKKGSSWADTH